MDLTIPHNLSPQLKEQLTRDLLSPAQEFMSRSSKQVRKQLVAAGYSWQLGGAVEVGSCSKCLSVGEALELIHSASLIIDDIQDSSPYRRGAASMHVQMGVGKAINLANWLYFKGFEKVESLDVEDATKVALLRLFHQALIGGHYGQALDLGTPMSQLPKEQASELCYASVKLKTGALTGLAFASGSVLAGAQGTKIAESYKMGEEIGVMLQNLDDLKNLKKDPLAPEKQFEDFRNQRPSLIWTIAARHESPDCWIDLLQALDLMPSVEGLQRWLEDYSIEEKSALYVQRSIQNFMQQNKNHHAVVNIIQQLVGAYEAL